VNDQRQERGEENRRRPRRSRSGNNCSAGTNGFGMIDTHAHVHDSAFDCRPGGSARTGARGRNRRHRGRSVATIDDSRRACEIAEAYRLCATVGVHPTKRSRRPPISPLRSTSCASSSGRASWPSARPDSTTTDDHSPRLRQREVLEAQIAYARERTLPLVFHQREAHDDFVAALRAGFDPARQRGVVHCFTGTPAEARTFSEEFGLLLGIGAW